MVLHAILSLSVAWLRGHRACLSACRALWMLADALRAAHLALGMPDTHTHSGTNEHLQPHHHRTTVLAIVSAQRSCS